MIKKIEDSYDLLNKDKGFIETEKQLNDFVSLDFSKYGGYFYYFYDNMKNKNIDYSNLIDYNSLVEAVMKEKIEEMKTYEKIIQNGKQDLQDLRMTY